MQGIRKVVLAIFMLPMLITASCFGTSGYKEEVAQEEEGHIYLENKSMSSTSILRTRYERLMPEVISQHEFIADEIARVEGILGLDIASGEGMTVSFNGINSQVSYIVPENDDELLPLFYSLFDYAGRTGEITPGDEIHAIILSGNKIYEIISPDCFVGEAVRDAIEVDPLQEIKLTAFNIAGKVDFISDRIYAGQELTGESAKIGIELESALVQELGFPDGGGIIRVYFYHPKESVDILEAGDRLEEYKGSAEGVLVLDDCLVLVESDDTDIINTVYRFIAIPPPTLHGLNRFKVDLKVFPGPDGSLPFFTNWDRTRFEWVTEYKLDAVDDSLSIGTLSNAMEELSGSAEFSMSIPTGALIALEPEEVGPYLEPTEWWPSENEKVKEALSDALKEVEGDDLREQVSAVREWVAENIRFEEADYDTRLPVVDVLESGTGAAWSRSDVLITLCRAAGLPSRQVAGHMYRGGFVIWAQVWLVDEKIWLDVDVGLDQVGVDSFHIPLWGTRDGRMEFVYDGWPKIRRLS
ncbi:MAG: transglutaminase domain-containing protein [bacterium]|nr:transglutaminase domain-containing protein [bacterium]